MANSETHRRRGQRQAQKTEAQEAAKAQAAKELLQTAGIANPEPKPAAPIKSRAEQRADARKAAEAQALKDSLVLPTEITPPKMVPGRKLALHELNAQARLANKSIQDEARDAAAAAGKAAFDVLRGRGASGPDGAARRHRNVAKAQEAMARVQARQPLTEDK